MAMYSPVQNSEGKKEYVTQNLPVFHPCSLAMQFLFLEEPMFLVLRVLPELAQAIFLNKWQYAIHIVVNLALFYLYILEVVLYQYIKNFLSFFFQLHLFFTYKYNLFNQGLSERYLGSFQSFMINNLVYLPFHTSESICG